MAAYGVVAFFCYVALFYTGQTVIGYHKRVRNIPRREALGKHVLLNVSLVVLPLAVLTMRSGQPHPVAMAIGASIVIAGLCLSMWAQWELGRYWVGGIGLHRDHRLIATGPYRYVRHPLYSGMLLSAAGLTVFGLNLLYALAVFCFSGAFAIRSLGEEYELKKKFKSQYVQYEATTGMLFPRVRKRG
ncbi:MAG: isoprenylcysteine carboxylmethyltransferase family protein [Candidatus Saccharibacteria bacterium]